ncbi:MAG: FAD-linked oxidase C-terminal domain-containing protein, partial [Thermodesulfobacteriota bacterium]|nr:FAD-linked oxidase C-terminal domain-containing protein [Thermodesulfobacteriota bacterium]
SFPYTFYPEEYSSFIATVPRHPEEVLEVTKLCYEEGIPIVTRGAHTNLSLHTVPTNGGCIVITKDLNRVCELDEENLIIVVEPGLITKDIHKIVTHKGLFYPPDPGSFTVSTIGGNVAENARGMKELKYGTIRDYVLGLGIITPYGDYVKAGSRTVKCVTGYNISGLMAGSKGIFGIFTEIILKLLPYPPQRKTTMAIFDRLVDAGETVAAIMGDNLLPASIEIMDSFTIKAVNHYFCKCLPEDNGTQAILLIESDGPHKVVERDMDRITALCKRHKAKEIQSAKNSEERGKIWSGRRAVLYALAKAYSRFILYDITVPNHKIPHIITKIHTISKKHDQLIGIFGHAGVGNLHSIFIVNKEDYESTKKLNMATHELFESVEHMGGVASTKYKMGFTRSQSVMKKDNGVNLGVIQEIKKALDPKMILNTDRMTSHTLQHRYG